MIQNESQYSVIADHHKVNGSIEVSGDLFIHGTFEGKIEQTKGLITISPTGVCKADINCDEIVIRGAFAGTLNSRGNVYIKSSANFEGEINSGNLVVSPGAVLKVKANTKDSL